MNRTRSLLLLTLLISACPFNSTGVVAQSPWLWLEYAPRPTEGVFPLFKNHVYRKFGITQADQTLSSLPQLLDAVKSHVGKPGTLFVLTDANTINGAADAQAWNAIRATGLEPVTPLVWGQSLYIFARAGSQPSPGARAHVYWRGPLKSPVPFRAGAVLARLGYSNAQILETSQPQNLINALNDDPNAVVVIHDPEPSMVIGDLVRGVTTKIQMLPAARVEKELIAETGGVVSMLTEYEARRFYPALDDPAKVVRGSQLVVSTSRSAVDDALPIVLTNARLRGTLEKAEAAVGSSLPQAMSDAYVLALFEYGRTRCDRENTAMRNQFRIALLNNYIEKYDDPYAVIAFLGHLASVEPDQLTLFLEIAATAHQLDAGNVIGWLQKRTEESAKQPARQYRQGLEIKEDVRAIFAGHAPQKKYEEDKQKLFIDGLELLRLASANLEIKARCEAVKQIRNSLATLAAVSLKPACGLPQPTRGLWFGVDFEPFFYLTVIDTIMAESKCQ